MTSVIFIEEFPAKMLLRSSWAKAKNGVNGLFGISGVPNVQSVKKVALLPCIVDAVVFNVTEQNLDVNEWKARAVKAILNDVFVRDG